MCSIVIIYKSVWWKLLSASFFRLHTHRNGLDRVIRDLETNEKPKGTFEFHAQTMMMILSSSVSSETLKEKKV